ncbi:MAG: hypothetical protein RIC12_01530 [Pirellulales bacterium]
MEFSTATNSAWKSPGLGELEAVELNPRHRLMLDQAMRQCGGDPATRNRKCAEVRELLALSQIAPPGRLVVEALDLRESLRAMLMLEVPVPCKQKEDGELEIAHRALLGFTYPNEAFQRPWPGFGFFQILMPRNVWLAQVKQPEQALCLAPQIPSGTRAALLLLRVYGALSMQSVQVDARDAAGVFEPAVARWWQDNLDRVPLTRTAFLEPTNREFLKNEKGSL